ncbi:MAG: AAA family ATPase, partial [Cryobacterium sp.]
MSRPRSSPWRDGVLEPAAQRAAEDPPGEPGEPGDPADPADQGQDEAPGEFEAEFEAEFDDGAGIAHQVIAVVAAKGGVGKTTVATNLAVGLARQAPLSVVLVDADVQFGDVATALSLTPARSLPDTVTAAAADDAMVLKAYLTPHPDGYYIVCGAESPADGDRVSGEQLGHLIGQLSEIFRIVIIDTAPGLGEHALAALEAATHAVFLCDMSVPGARGLRKEIAALTTVGIMPPTRHVVLNFADRV